MVTFDFKRTTRKCAVTEKPFAPGEQYVSALFNEGDDLVRKDYSVDAWSGPSEECIGWWYCTVPNLESGKVYWAPNDVLLSFFDSIAQLPGKEATTYVTALLLLQKKILQLDESDEEAVMNVMHRKSKTRYAVDVIELSDSEKQMIQQELSEQLFTDEAPQTEGPQD